MGRGPVNEGAIAGEGGANLQPGGGFSQSEKIRANQRFTAGKKQHRHLKVRQGLDKGQGLLSVQFTFISFWIRIHVTVPAGEVAGAGHVPGHHRPQAFPHTVGRMGGTGGITQPVAVMAGTGEKLAETDQ